MNMLNQAKRYVYITTPYLIIDNELCQAIENAAIYPRHRCEDHNTRHSRQKNNFRNDQKQLPPIY